MGRSEAGLTAACTVKQVLKRWQGSGVWLPVWWRLQSWPQELINQLRMVRLQSHNLSSKKVTFRRLNKSDNSEKLCQERLYSKDQRARREEMGKKERGKKERQRKRKERRDKEKIRHIEKRNQMGRKVEKGKVGKIKK